MDAREQPMVAEEQPASVVGKRRLSRLRTWQVVATVLLLAVGALIVVPRLTHDDGMYRGPLSYPDAGSAFSRSGVWTGEPGQVVSVGIQVPYHDVGKPVLDRLLLVSPLPNLMVTEVGAAPCPLGAGGGPRDACPGLRPVAGYTVLPGASDAARLTLVVGFTTTGRQVTGFPAVVLEYHLGESSYRAIYLQGGSFCPAASCEESTLDEAQGVIRVLAEEGSFDAIHDLAVSAGQQTD